ncbi:hypothetical protein N8E86_11375 [Avibacterium paragallinarum]|uniref:hypothetical protein n=1 Tax=Avibacterium paragallinarum TaxID=728 RepID=UPI0021F7C61E|nr:hypothetical protein [Avibacterium paragallinarum]UXN34631.1 hypothetical protein N8E86_11375 [Avibacterium paragallinarum]
MGFIEQQESFQKYIDENFISVYDFIHSQIEEQKLSFQESCSYLLTIANHLIKNQSSNHCYCEFCCELPSPPYESYSLRYVSQYSFIDSIKFAVKHNRFRSEKNVKKWGLLKGEIQDPFTKKEDKCEITNTKDSYNDDERNTHLQMIAVLAEEVAKLSKSYRWGNNINKLKIAELISTRSQEIEIESLKSRSVETYRQKLVKVAKFYEQ